MYWFRRAFLPAALPLLHRSADFPAEGKAASGALKNRLCGGTKIHRRYLGPCRPLDGSGAEPFFQESRLQDYFARSDVGPALLPPQSAFERNAATLEALQNGKIIQPADRIMTKM